MNLKSNFAPLRLCGRHFLFICLSLVIPASAHSQSDQALKAPRKDLLPLVWPYLGSIEESVREQVATAQDALAAVAKNPAASDADLTEAYGKMGQVYQAYALLLQARICYTNALVLAPKDFRWIYLVGRMDHESGR